MKKNASTFIWLLLVLTMTNCKKNKTAEPTANDTNPPNTTPIMEGYLKFMGSTYYSNFADPGATNYTAKQLFWENNNGTITNQVPDSTSLNNVWMTSVSTGVPVDMRTWTSSNLPFNAYNSINWYSKATSKTPTINQSIAGLAYLDFSYFPSDQNTSDPEISVSKIASLSFMHPPIVAAYTKYSIITSLSGVPNSTKKIEKIVNGNSPGVIFTASEVASLFSSPSYTSGSIWIEAYNESIISPASSTSFTISSISGVSTQVKFY